MVETLTQKVGNETDKPKNNFKKYLVGSLVGGALALGTIGGYEINEYVNYNGEKKGNQTVQLKDISQFVSDNSVSDKNSKKDDKKESVKYSEKDDRKNDKEESEEDIAKKADAVAIRYSNVFAYIYDENTKSGELRVNLEKLSEEEKLVYISMKRYKGTKYNKEKDYISFSNEFEDKKFYKSLKDLAILSQFSKKDNINDKEREFIHENAPDVYRILFLFDNKYDKKEIKKEETKKDGKKYDPKEHPFLNFAVDFWLRAQVANEEKKFEESEGIDIFKGLRNDNKDGPKKSKDIKKKNLDEAPAPGIKYAPPAKDTLTAEDAPPPPKN